MVERRIGLSRASLADPARALPFAQPESDRLSLGGAVEWLPGSDMARASLRAEVHDGDDRKGHRVELAGDAPLGAGAALLARIDRSLYDRPLGAGPTRSVDERSLVGLALRPVTTAALDALLRLEYRRTSNPLGTSTVALPGDDRRVIAASDVVWSPARGLELAGRWAARLSEVATAPGAEPLALRAHFLGGRVRQDVGEAWGVRLDARGLLEAGSAASAWSLAPSLARRLDDRMEMEAGWRFGTLRDRDFGSDGDGFFLLLNLRITERDVRAPAAVWRERISRGR
jgi:hypothetical protein